MGDAGAATSGQLKGTLCCNQVTIQHSAIRMSGIWPRVVMFSLRSFSRFGYFLSTDTNLMSTEMWVQVKHWGPQENQAFMSPPPGTVESTQNEHWVIQNFTVLSVLELHCLTFRPNDTVNTTFSQSIPICLKNKRALSCLGSHCYFLPSVIAASRIFLILKSLVQISPNKLQLLV